MKHKVLCQLCLYCAHEHILHLFFWITVENTVPEQGN